MNIISKKTSLYITFITLFFSHLGAKEPELLINTEFNCISMDSSIRSDKLYYIQDEKPESIRVNNLFRSPVYKYKGVKTISFYRQGPNGTHELAATAAINPRLKKTCLLFVSVASNTGAKKYKIIVFDDNTNDYPAGSYRFYNLTPEPIAVKFGDTTFKISPKKTKTHIRKTTDALTIPIRIVMMEGDKLKPLYSNEWPQKKMNRSLVFIRKSGAKESGKIKVKVFADIVLPPKAPGAK